MKTIFIYLIGVLSAVVLPLGCMLLSGEMIYLHRDGWYWPLVISLVFTGGKATIEEEKSK